MRVHFHIALHFIICHSLFSQARNDNIWILGIPAEEPEEYFGGTKLDFIENEVEVSYFNSICFASEPGILCSSAGRLMAYLNGCHIFNSTHEIMENGDSISYGENWETYCDYRYPGTQNNLILPWPGDSNKAIALYLEIVEDFTTYKLLYSIIEFSDAHPLGIVTEKDKLLLDPGRSGLLTAVKHGNGRDWWMVVPEYNSNRFFSLLLDPSGIAIRDTQAIGKPWGERAWGSQAVFSPDGTKYIRHNPWKGLDIFEFDRCSGELLSIRELGPMNEPVLDAGGVALSSDSRWLYVANSALLFQYDLFAQDLDSSRVLVGQYDGFFDPFPTNFYQMMLAPNDKIYVFASNGNKSIHVINRPNKKGSECEFLQHSVHLPTYIEIGSVNFPYYRLGPDDGSHCDTLGINNVPIADFRYEIDSTLSGVVSFTNTSYFKPESFHWDFGNSTTSNARDPMPIQYDQEKIYSVCLTASNQYGSNTFCRTINFMDSLTLNTNVTLPKGIIISPNPFHHQFTLESNYEDLLMLQIFSPVGAMVHQQSITHGKNVISNPSFQDGIYYYTLLFNGFPVERGILINHSP